MPSFNLVEQPWIPCSMLDGETRELGLSDALLSAHHIREISDPSPIMTVSLHRLLLAILHRKFGPEDSNGWSKMWERGEWDSDALREYLGRWRHRFELFDERWPFYQVASLDFGYQRSVTQLTHELVSGANPATLFDHTLNPVLSAAEAARYLVAFQSFAVGGLVSLEKGQDPKLFKSADAAPLTKCAVMLVKGSTLFRTLMLNLHRLSPADGEPFESQPSDVPAWERDEETRAGDRPPTGYLDLLTWQSRRIRLHPEDDGHGATRVRHVVIMKGNQFPDGWSIRGKETMAAFRKNPRPSKGQEPWMPVGFQEERVLWRDSLALFQSVEERHERPRIFDWLHDLGEEEGLEISSVLPVEAYGLSTDRAKVLFWRHERLPLPLAYLGDPELLDSLRLGLELAEKAGRLLQGGFEQETGDSKGYPRPLHKLGSLLLSPQDDARANGDAVRKLVQHMAPGQVYWARLEVPFRRLLVGLAEDRAASPDRDPEGWPPALSEWALVVRSTALEAFGAAVSSLDSSARTLKARAVAEREFRWRLNGIFKEYIPEENHPNNDQGGGAVL